jgi:GNAT superfamily N-acetyltransferase
VVGEVSEERATTGRVTPPIGFRRPVEGDYPAIVEVIDEWWGGRRVRHLLPRLWLEHFRATSWIAETEDGRLAGFLIGFVSPEHPDEGHVHMVAANPNLRRRGLGRQLYERFFADARAAGVRRVQAVTWPGNRVSIDFHRSIGFRPDDGPGSTPIYGVPAFADHDGPGEDRVRFVLDL